MFFNLYTLSIIISVINSVATLKGTPKLHKIKIGEDIPDYWASDEDILDLKRKGITFKDTTYGSLEAYSTKVLKSNRLLVPNFISESRGKQVRKLIRDINVERLKQDLVGLTSFYTRYYKSPFGTDAAQWVHDTVAKIVQGSPYKVTVTRLKHRGWPQFSISCLLENSKGQSKSSYKERVLLSSHLDSTALLAPMIMPAPGADDDGSGVVTLLEVLRLLVANPVVLERPVEFLFFSAEEAGLLGSQSVVRKYLKDEITAALLHIDMDGYRAPNSEPGIGLLTDYTDPKLNSFIKKLVHQYTRVRVKETTCGYACSDHFSWTEAGYPAAALFEGTFDEKSPHIHTRRDTVASIDFDHMAEFVKVAVAYALHMSDEI